MSVQRSHLNQIKLMTTDERSVECGNFNEKGEANVQLSNPIDFGVHYRMSPVVEASWRVFPKSLPL